MSQRGNILFLILLAVVLFAALSYAVTAGMRGGGSDASKESVPAGVSTILGFFTATENAAQRMRLVGGLAPENMSFGYNYATYGGTTYFGHNNTNCTSDACRVFRPAGGGVEAQTFEKLAVADPAGITAGNVKPGYFNIVIMQWPYAGTNANDIVLVLSYIKAAYCLELNRSLGIATPPTVSGTWVDAGSVANWDAAGYTISANATSLLGKNTFATSLYDSGKLCHIYQLLIPR